jgi:hypothetical protein
VCVRAHGKLEDGQGWGVEMGEWCPSILVLEVWYSLWLNYTRKQSSIRLNHSAFHPARGKTEIDPVPITSHYRVQK